VSGAKEWSWSSVRAHLAGKVVLVIDGLGWVTETHDAHSCITSE
jgi:hypothetical protein